VGGGIVTRIFNHGTRLRWMVSFTPRPILIGWEAGSAQSRSYCCGEEKNPSFCQESNPGRPACSLVTILRDLKSPTLWRF